MATIKDIAKRAGVSVATVSYVINDTRPVHPEKKARVLKAIKELDYVPNASARGLRAKYNKTIGLVISDITNPFYPDLAKGCQDAVQSQGYTLMMYNTDDKADRLNRIIQQLRSGKIDGLILANLLIGDEQYKNELEALPYPMVLAHRQIDSLAIDSVTANDYESAKIATQHLINSGHKNILLVDGILDSPVSQKRRLGYIDSMKRENLDRHIIHGYGRYKTSYEAINKVFKSGHKDLPTAIFATSDMMAFGVIDALKKMNFSVPKDIAVIGFDDLFIASFPSIELSTVRVPRYEIGKQAAEMLIEKIDTKKDKQTKEIKKIVLDSELIIRQSSEKNL